MCECSYDYDMPAFYSRTTRTARKRHRCYECGGAILPGEAYERVGAMWDGRVQSIATCARCTDVREFVRAKTDCCIQHGNMLEDLRDAVEHHGWETPGLRFGYLRRTYMADQFRKQMREVGL